MCSCLTALPNCEKIGKRPGPVTSNHLQAALLINHLQDTGRSWVFNRVRDIIVMPNLMLECIKFDTERVYESNDNCRRRFV
jgi:hypothetical protein